MNAAPETRELAGVRVLAALNGLELFGHERANIEVFKTLRSLGAEVIVGVNARDDGGAAGRELTRLGFPTFLLPFNPQWSLRFLRKHPAMLWKNPWAALRSGRRFRRAIAEFKPTHIHVGSPLAYSYIWPALAISRVPLVYRMGDSPPVGSRFNLAIWKSAMRRSSTIVAISRFVRDAAILAGAMPERLQLIYSLAPTRMSGDSAASEINEPFEAERLVYVGAIAEQKGLIPLVEAVSALIPERPSLQLDICGESRWDADFRRSLLQRISELAIDQHVHFHGHVDDPGRYYRHAAVHVAPSIAIEASGNVVFEAKREGCPSVVFPSGGLSEAIRHQVDGFVCRSKTTEALTEALRWMFADPARLAEMRKATRADYLARFGPERFAREWAAIYRGETGR